MQARSLGASGDAARYTKRQPTQHEQAAQRYDERRKPRVHDNKSIEIANESTTREGQQD